VVVTVLTTLVLVGAALVQVVEVLDKKDKNHQTVHQLLAVAVMAVMVLLQASLVVRFIVQAEVAAVVVITQVPQALVV
jgi:hypothetical protein